MRASQQYAYKSVSQDPELYKLVFQRRLGKHTIVSTDLLNCGYKERDLSALYPVYTNFSSIQTSFLVQYISCTCIYKVIKSFANY